MIRLFSILLVFIVSCTENSDIKDDSLKSNLDSSNDSRIDSKKQPCYYFNERVRKRCDSTLIKIFNKHYFIQNIKWNEESSFINCDSGQKVVLRKFGDSNCCNPRIYDLTYDILINNSSIYQFRMSAGPDEVFETVSPIVKGQLAAYKMLMQGKFKIGYNEAKKLAVKNHYNSKHMTIELFYDEKKSIVSASSFYWLIDSNKTENSRFVLHIDPISGKVETKKLEILKIP